MDRENQHLQELSELGGTINCKESSVEDSVVIGRLYECEIYPQNKSSKKIDGVHLIEISPAAINPETNIEIAAPSFDYLNHHHWTTFTVRSGARCMVEENKARRTRELKCSFEE